MNLRLTSQSGTSRIDKKAVLYERENRVILVVGCYFTKRIESYALPDQEAETVVNALVTDFFAHFGVPRDIVA